MSNSIKRKWLYFFSLLIFFIGAISIFTSIHQTDRAPAALSGSFSWQEADNRQREKILSVAEILKKDSNYIVNLGDTADVSMCSKYQYVNIEFVADGVAVSGNKPTLVFFTKCNASSETISVFIPRGELMQRPAQATSFEYNGEQTVSVKVENVIGFWPETWVVNKISFYNEQNGQTFSLTQDHLQKAVLKMDWTN
ncbi:MAG: hypothetical protein KDD37_08195 [Bdellovibrionales bacterium]|nr:hypothetical protein [Bdellovibrionales bacterium]